MVLKFVSRHWLEASAIAICLGGLLFAWQWKYGFNVGDEGLLWYISQRIRFGELPIRDTFGYDPGRYLWSAAWFKILGADGLFEQRLANTAFGIIGLACAYASMLEARVRTTTRVAIAVLLAVALCYPLHKVYEQSLSLVGVALVACVLRNPNDRRWWIALGISTGIAAIIGRNSGVYYAMASCAAVVTTWRLLGRSAGFRAARIYAAGVLIGYSPMVLWFAADSQFRHAMIQSILFTPQWQLPLPIPFPWRVVQNFSSVSVLQATMVSWLVILTIALYLTRTLGLIKTTANGKAMTPLLALEVAALYVGLPYLHQSFGRADFSHIAQGILPLFLLASTQMTKPVQFGKRLLAGLFLIIAMISWLPMEPIARSWLLNRQDVNATRSFPIGRHNFELERGTAMLLLSVRRVAEECHVDDGQLVAMPHFPGLLAYLHLRSPYWEMYYLYARDATFQRNEIRQMKAFGTRVAVVDWSAALDGRQDMRFQVLNPLLASYIRTNFGILHDVPRAPDNISFMVRDCSP